MLSWVKSDEYPFRIFDIKIYQGVTIGPGHADPMLICSSGMKGCPPQVFRVLYAEVPYQTL